MLFLAKEKLNLAGVPVDKAADTAYMVCTVLGALDLLLE